MTIEELELVRSFSKAANSPAYKNYKGEMYRKIVVKRMSKYFDLSPEANRAIALDHLVIGDPTISGSLDGPSEDYRNLIVKTQTVAGLDALKDKLHEENGDGNGDTEPPTEDEKKEKPYPPKEDEKKKKPEPDPEPDPEPESKEPKRLENQWEKPILKLLIGDQIVGGDNDTERQHRAVYLLNHSPFTAIAFGELEIVPAVAWVLGCEQVKEAHPKMKSENRMKKALKLWDDEDEKNALIDLAMKNIPPD